MNANYINRKIFVRRQFYGKATFHVLIKCILFVFLSVICVYAGDNTGLRINNEWKEIEINLPDDPSNVMWYSWCGSDNKKLIAQLSDNVKKTTYFGLIDVETGNIDEIREKPLSLNPSCSPDGQYVFFQKKGPAIRDDIRKNTGQWNLYVYDTRTRKTSLIYESDKGLPVQALEEPVSPSYRYLIGPENWQEKVMLPNGENVEIVSLPTKTTKKGEISEFDNVKWSFDGARLFLYAHEEKNALILNPKTGKQTTIPIKIKGALLKKYIHPAPDDTKIYVTGYFGTFMEGVTNLYSIDLKTPNKPPKLLVRDIDDYGVGADGTIIFARHNIHPKQRGNFAHGIYLYDKQGKTTLLKEIRDISGFGFVYVYIRVSRDGWAVAYPRKISKTREVMTVLRKERKN